MKITYIVPGFGGVFYCGNCLRDSSFSRSLREIGHDAITLPLYLPHSIEEFVNQPETPVFYGAVNIYLKQNFRLFRKMPRWLYNFFNSPSILKFAARKSSSTRATGLEEMTISMLNGTEGYQKEELEQLVAYLRDVEKPDIVHLSNALLLGLAKRIKKELGVPVFCSLQDEDVWVDDMSGPYAEKVWKLMGEKAADVDAFISVSHYFARFMKETMKIPEEKIHVVHIGVDPAAYKAFSPTIHPPVIAYLSRMNEENGFGLLVDAFIKLKEKPEFSNARLKISGGKTGDDHQFINLQTKKLLAAGCMDSVEFVDDFRTSNLSEFFKDVSILSVPVLKGEAFGLYMLEALASGIPLVQPDLGAFSEIIQATGGGVVYSPNSPEELSATLSKVLSDPERLLSMSQSGRKAVETIFNTKNSTERIVTVYKTAIEKQTL